ncbi:hypothetical protein DFR49_3108 [Hephaestia caeni]|jgi:hypothetical protein|uniref:Uncharacterized protein n=1 Tax=Hephaestia caeni TaxID=645617 RepID=A0A397NIA4_9SPHN|nr:hypothetical protein [Hephaestia caeni]RIA37230.1 hypothetical protein DFR49_3108 [Hephaestia caeni]
MSSAALWAAIIGAGSALVVSFLKDFLFEWLKERRAKRQSQAEVYRQYLAPLCETCEKIVWRSKEIFVDKRHAFLKTTTLPLDFNAYKRISTLYRIATLIGWIRGMNLELRALPRGKSNYATPIAKQITAFQKALADGPHVELHRVTRLSALWSIDLSRLDQAEQAALAMRFEVEAHAATGGNLKSNPDHLRNLPANEKLEICRCLSAYLAKETGSKAPDEEVIRETVDHAVGGLSYREALLYRDWQDALGDAMIERDPDSVRQFRIVGYEGFTALLETEAPWFEVLAKSIDDIDFDEIDPSDFRSQQLRDVSAAVAAILIGIAQTKDAFLLDPASLDAAKRLSAAIAAATQAQGNDMGTCAARRGGS